LIQFEKDGVTLYYVDANGTKIAHNYIDGQAYDDMLQIRSSQLQAIAENAQTQSNYNTALANAQASVNAGRPVDAPAKPLMKVVSDTGGVTYTPFSPALADLVPLVVNTKGDGQIAAVVPDRQAVMYNMVQAMFRKMFPEAL
jgi:hypothetical protein